MTLSAESGLSQVEVPSLILQTFVERIPSSTPPYTAEPCGSPSRSAVSEDLDGGELSPYPGGRQRRRIPEQLLEDFYAEDAGRLKGHIGLFNLRARLSLI